MQKFTISFEISVFIEVIEITFKDKETDMSFVLARRANTHNLRTHTS